MSLTIKHLNDDASFLLTFRPSTSAIESLSSQHDFNIVLDPWLGGESTTFHSKFSTSRSRKKPCINSLLELPELDLVIISQDKTDHCHGPTLRTLPRNPNKTVVLAGSAAVRMIRGWKHFSPETVKTMPKYDEKNFNSVYRVAIPPLSKEGMPGEVTITFIVQKMDITALHNAICITYRPPTNNRIQKLDQGYLPSPPASPVRDSSASNEDATIPQTLSVMFSPHGIVYPSLQPFVDSHLKHQSALPLTALLHCFNRIENPWYLGGNICTGMPGGVEIARRLHAKVWISSHDGDKDVSGIVTTQLVTTKYKRDDIEKALALEDGVVVTQALLLESGDEKTIS